MAKDSNSPLGSDRSMLGFFVENVEDYAIFTLDPAGRITSWNVGAERLKGYSPDEIIGKPLSIFYTKEDRERGWPAEMLRRASAEGRAKDDGPRVRKDGTQFWAHVVLTAVHDETGALQGFVKVTRDISEQRRTERELRDNEARFASFAQNFPGFTWIADSESRFRYANFNFEHALASKSSEYVGKLPQELFSPEVAETIMRSNRMVISTHEPVLLTETVTARGETHHFLVSKFPIQTDDSLLVGAVSIDITGRIEAEAELQQMRDELFEQERIGSIAQLSSSLAHDLNNTLNAVALRLGSIRDRANVDQLRDIDTVAGLVAKAGQSVARVQDFVRTHREAQLQEVDLARIVEDAVKVIGPRFADRGVNLNFSQGDRKLPPVVGLLSDLRQVFENLLTNAADAMLSGGEVEISATLVGGQIEISIADRGIGIDANNLERIFEPFFTTRPSRSSGLGLSFAASVMARLGGTIGASNRVGGGAVFMLLFPVAKGEIARVGAAKERQPPSREVLVIDDDLDNLESMKAALELRGYDVSISSSGADALQLLRAGNKYDAIICDVGMPDMNGWEVASRIAELHSGARIYMLTGWANEIPRDDPRRKLVVDVLAKPIDLAHIDGILRAEGA
jgi:PAS domain S-box-containing protein